MRAGKRKAAGGVCACLILAAMTAVLLLAAMKSGSIRLTWGELLRGLFQAWDARVAAVYDLRFPRILIALLAGAMLSGAGLLLQAVLKNPLADPGLIGISGGAAFAAAVVSACFPALYLSLPLFAFLGGVFAFLVIYALSWKAGLDPVRILLIGVAVGAVFSGLTAVLDGMTAAGGVSVSAGGLTQRSWTDVTRLAGYAAAGLAAALAFAPACNLMALDDRTVRGLGVRVDHLRLGVSCAAVWLAAAATASVGVTPFLALLAPHIARRIVGSDHRILTPFALLLGAFTLLLADTVGRLAAAPREIPAAGVMSVAGGPFFIFLLRRRDRIGR
ncbi:MAG: iron ABC transporter permease [Oscillospiraceae bacterium]|jgi:iron complex transport system permease protein|nr:iron ABC transporter permease [Oscillospiraceae bacterium]